MSGPDKIPGKIYVIGAGLSGLAAATALAAKGTAVTLFEAAGQAGGRCRSYFDPVLGTTIDNGNHLVLSGNQAVRAYLKRIGALERVRGPRRALFSFVELQSRTRWTLAPNNGPVPWWIAAPGRRVPGTRAQDYAEYAKLLWANPRQTIAQTLSCKGRVWDRLMEPFLLAALNTEPRMASAALAGAVLRDSLARGGRACRPRIAMPSLAEAFVNPALNFLADRGGEVKLGTRLRAIAFGPRAAMALEFPEATIALGPADTVILAVPSWVAAELVPDLAVPDDYCAIVNGHFQFVPPRGAPAILGVIGGTAQWIFTFEDRIAVTVSGADAIVDQEREALAALLWRDVCVALDIGDDTPLPKWQIVKEKRATFAATPAQDAKRPRTQTKWRNLFLAGDWTDTGLPATIEGALRAGEKAAGLAHARYSL